MKSALERNSKMRVDDLIKVTFEVVDDYIKKTAHKKLGQQNVKKSVAQINFNAKHKNMLEEEQMEIKYEIELVGTDFIIRNLDEGKTYRIVVQHSKDMTCRAISCQGSRIIHPSLII